jgi:hypothetical protein
MQEILEESRGGRSSSRSIMKERERRKKSCVERGGKKV